MATQPHDRSLKILKEFLQTAVPLWIIRFKGLPWEELQQIMKESERILEESGELAVFAQVKKGQTAQAFNAVARAIAALSFVPGGLDIFGLHFETKHEDPTMQGMTKGTMATEHRMGAVDGWVVTHDGETIKAGFADDGEAMKWLHDRHSYSVDHAVKHEGYDIVLVRGGRIEWSYKRDILGKRLGLSGRFERMSLVELLEELARLYPTLMIEDTTKPGDGPFPVKDVLDGIKFSLEQEDVSVDLRIFLESPHWFWAMESLGFVTVWAFPEDGGSLLAFKEHEAGLPVRRPPFVSGTHRSMDW
jgi:hypothetical protein